ncbi:hypothetical protein ACIBI4_04230 [Streptomyces sp. NPDC050418]|uniref:hypothetical protein n=1 Tax=Streptomyces sp. NPDC050418 TaxID=3365612 RepID=UPI0037A22372
MAHLADPLRFLCLLAAWVATPWAIAPHSVLLAVISVVVLLAMLTLFATPVENGLAREQILGPSKPGGAGCSLHRAGEPMPSSLVTSAPCSF